MIFVVNLEKSFHKRGWPASMDIEGANGKTLDVIWEKIDLLYVKQLVKNQDIIMDIREMGFKRLVLKNGKQEWSVDLKN